MRGSIVRLVRRCRLATGLLAAVVLLGGQLVLATHGYEHDLATSADVTCATCAFAHAGGDSPVPVAVAPFSAPAIDRPRLVPAAPADRAPRLLPPPRGPPRPAS